MGLEIVEEYRGISVATLESAGVYWVDGDDYAVRVPYPHMSGYWYERKMLDPRLRGTHQGPKILSPSGGEHHMYNPLRLGPNAGLVIYAEGEYDTLSLIDAGFPAVGNQGADTFKLGWCRLFSGAVNVIAVDADEAGHDTARKMQRFMARLNVRPIILELEEDEDINDLHKEGRLYPAIYELLTEYEINPADYELN